MLRERTGMRDDKDITSLVKLVWKDRSLNYKLKGLYLAFIVNPDGASLSTQDLANLWDLSETQVRTYMDIFLRGKYIKRLGRSANEGYSRGSASVYKYGIGDRYVKDAEGYSFRETSSDS